MKKHQLKTMENRKINIFQKKRNLLISNLSTDHLLTWDTLGIVTESTWKNLIPAKIGSFFDFLFH